MSISAPSSPDDFLGPKPSVIELRAADRWEAIEELINHLVATHKIEPGFRESVVATVKQRESAGGTGIGFGIALPHGSIESVTDVVYAIGFSRKGIQFNAPDAKLVDLVLVFLLPTGQFQQHVNTLADIAKLLHRDDFRDGLRRRFM